MLVSEPTQEMMEKWKHIYKQYRPHMLPNRKTGVQLDSYFRNKYAAQAIELAPFKKVVEFNILENEHSLKKCQGKKVNINVYRIDDIYIGIDLTSGEYHVECDDIEKIIPMYNDLFLYRGLDEDDLDNYFLLAEYITLCKEKDNEVL